MQAKWFETNISCSHNKNISRLAGRSSFARKGSMLMVTGELEISENQLYCEVYHFEFIAGRIEGIKRDAPIWIEDEETKLISARRLVGNVN